MKVSLFLGLILGVVVGAVVHNYVISHSYATALLVALGVCLAVLKRRRKKPSKPFLAPQVERFTHPKGIPGSRTVGIMSGLRVVDLSTFLAAPQAAKCLGELGAEVIHVEPVTGDEYRQFLKVLQPGREQRCCFMFGIVYWFCFTVFCSACFDWVNANKSSVVLDLAKAESMIQLKKLLKDADIFITNVRLQSLRKYNLQYEQLKNEFPALIYVGLTAWGSKGPDCEQPGYDVGAFWGYSGLSATAQLREGNFSYYPAGLLLL
jgi:crotonobetainyl-CoA:carnitine CoA-transferase CaiB-like acyl-CoA transferase